MANHLYLYEANSRLFLRQLAEKHHRPLTLAAVPQDEWQRIRDLGFDLIWLMGAWQRSPGSKVEALRDPFLRQEYERALPGWTDDDVGGSPYAVLSYTLDSALGKTEDLPRLKARLNECGLRLILDFVPNHLARDHEWTISHPDWFVRGDEDRVREHPDWFFKTPNGVYLAHGKDPNFPPWTDTAQVNLFSPEVRNALIDELEHIARGADGVRCDMAMLALNEVFKGIWGDTLKDVPQPGTEFWADAIGRVKNKHPEFLFIAEAYWGLERQLQHLGFDCTYDKQLYDLLRTYQPDEIRRYLAADQTHHQRSVHFVENHDEARAITAFGRERSMAAAVVSATIPGVSMFHHGQLEGRRIHVPVQLLREPAETDDPLIMQFYERLLAACRDPALRQGEWSLIPPMPAWEGSHSRHSLLAWYWRQNERLCIVAVNYSPGGAQARLRIPMPGSGQSVKLRDALTGAIYDRDPGEMSEQGLYVELGPYRSHILSLVE